MNEHEKSIELAKLMGWRVTVNVTIPSRPKTMVNTGTSEWFRLCPYSDDHWGLAQFAAILLKFLRVMLYFEQDSHIVGGVFIIHYRDGQPTQKQILDEILRMRGVDI